MSKTSILSVTATPSVPTTFDADSGSATPAANTLTVTGSGGVSTSGSGSTLTITGSEEDYVTDAGTASSSGNSINVSGGTGIDTSGAADTVTVAVDGTVPTSIATDSGTVTPSGNVFSILGSGTVSTSGAGSTLTVTGSGGGGGTGTANFQAYMGSAYGLVTGDNTTYSLIFDTERYDIGGDYNNSTGVFTAPQDGYYLFTWCLLPGNLSGNATNWLVTLVTSNKSYAFTQGNMNLLQVSSQVGVNGSAIVDMDAADTAHMTIQISQVGGKIVSFGSSTTFNWFSGISLTF